MGGVRGEEEVSGILRKMWGREAGIRMKGRG